MRRLVTFVALLLTVTFVALYVLRERAMKSAGIFFYEYVEGVIPWLVILAAVAAIRWKLKQPRLSHSDCEGGR